MSAEVESDEAESFRRTPASAEVESAGVESLRKTLQAIATDLRLSATFFGSRVTGLSHPGSDLDVSFSPTTREFDPREDTMRVQIGLSEVGFVPRLDVSSTRFPRVIVRLGGIVGDISFDNRKGLELSELTKGFVESLPESPAIADWLRARFRLAFRSPSRVAGSVVAQLAFALANERLASSESPPDSRAYFRLAARRLLDLELGSSRPVWTVAVREPDSLPRFHRGSRQLESGEEDSAAPHGRPIIEDPAEPGRNLNRCLTRALWKRFERELRRFLESTTPAEIFLGLSYAGPSSAAALLDEDVFGSDLLGGRGLGGSSLSLEQRRSFVLFDLWSRFRPPLCKAATASAAAVGILSSLLLGPRSLGFPGLLMRPD